MVRIALRCDIFLRNHTWGPKKQNVRKFAPALNCFDTIARIPFLSVRLILPRSARNHEKEIEPMKRFWQIIRNITFFLPLTIFFQEKCYSN